MTYQPLFYNPGSIPPTMASKSGKNAIKYYILLKDIVGFEKKKSRLLRTETLDQYQALMGEIFYKEEKKNEFDEDAFVSAENQDRHVNCTEEKFEPLSSKLFRILIAVPSKIERMYLLDSKEMVKKILNIEVGDMVDVELNNSEGSKTVSGGRIGYVGQIQGRVGEYIGIRFEEAYGDSDGSIDRKFYFHAKAKHGLFVSADKIKKVIKRKDIPKEIMKRQKSSDNSLQPQKNHGPNKSFGNHYNTRSQAPSSMPAGGSYAKATKGGKADSKTKPKKGRKKEIESVGDEYEGHQVNTRVVFFTENAKQICGVLKFLGYLKSDDDTVWAVVETDNYFTVAGYADTKLKFSKELKALKIPSNKGFVARPLELMKEEVLMGQIHEDSNKPCKDVENSGHDEEAEVLKPKELNAREFKNELLKQQQDIEMKSVKKENMYHARLEDKDAIRTVNSIDPSTLTEEFKNHIPNPDSYSKAPKESSDYASINPQKVGKGFAEIGDDPSVIPSGPNQPIYDEVQQPGTRYSTKRTDYQQVNDIKPSRALPDIYTVDTTQLQGSSALQNQYLQRELDQMKHQLPTNTSSNLPQNFYNGVNDVQPGQSFQMDINQGDQLQRPGMEDKRVAEEPPIELTVEMMVEVSVNKKPYYGVVKWLGLSEVEGKMVDIVGLEMEEAYNFASTNGIFQGQKRFDCPSGNSFFTKAKKCKPDRRFQMEEEQPKQKKRVNKTQTPRPKEDVPLTGYSPPATELKQRKHLGRMKGIQGHHNSCYMDSTLFAMFSFTDAFDAALLRERKDDVTEDYKPAQKILKEEIVNPLRQNGFVQSGSVMNLRKILNKHAGKLGGFMTEEKDPEELVVLLFEKVIPMEPLISIKTPNAVNRSLLYQIFPPKPDYDLPSVQDLLTLSLIDTDLLLNEIPPVMVLQMPRFGTQKMCERIFINPQLDLTNILYTSEKLCHFCNERASCMCKDCSGQPKPFGAENRNAFLCKHCMEVSHRHPDRAHHKWNEIELCKEPIKYDKGSLTMELFAVVCINTSHYVSFVKCGDGDKEKWVFFDSMADREGGDSDGYNIPEVAELPDLKKHLKDVELVKGLKKEMHNKNNERLLRFFEDASLCMYRSKEYLAYQ
ncbi:uncharacterized protein [Clytia hemisphaerica]|uniref:uncharacterized protein isoform X2 n=1 Tax=Clytia hemisphaerica TaxID=252671 RepID=UPI0034D5D34C